MGRCRRCGPRPRVDFHKNLTRKPYIQSLCITCKKAERVDKPKSDAEKRAHRIYMQVFREKYRARYLLIAARHRAKKKRQALSV